MAAWHGGAPTARARTHPIFGRSLEAAARVCDTGAGTAAARDQRRRAAARRRDNRSGECRIPARDYGKWRRARRALHQAGRFWWRGRAAFPYSPRMKTLLKTLTALTVLAILAPGVRAQWEKRTTAAVPRLPDGQVNM